MCDDEEKGEREMDVSTNAVFGRCDEELTSNDALDEFETAMQQGKSA